MFNYRFQNMLSFRRAQVTVFFLSIMATLVVLAFIVIIVGKTAKDKTYSDNAADAGALAACSVMAQGFNDNSEDNGDEQDGQREYESTEAQREGERPQGTANDSVHNPTKQAKVAAHQGAAVPPGTSALAGDSGTESKASAGNVQHQENTIDSLHEATVQNDMDQRRNMYGGLIS